MSQRNIPKNIVRITPPSSQETPSKDVLSAGKILGREVTQNISELLDQQFYIHNIEIKDITLKGNSTRIAILTISKDLQNLEKYHTFSSVLITQLEQLKKYTDNNKIIEATLRKQKRYFYLE